MTEKALMARAWKLVMTLLRSERISGPFCVLTTRLYQLGLSGNAGTRRSAFGVLGSARLGVVYSVNHRASHLCYSHVIAGHGTARKARSNFV